MSAAGTATLTNPGDQTNNEGATVSSAFGLTARTIASASMPAGTHVFMPVMRQPSPSATAVVTGCWSLIPKAAIPPVFSTASAWPPLS